MNLQLRERLVQSLAKELKTSSVRGSDADWYIGFNPEAETPVEETEYDPKTGKVVNNTEIGPHATFLQQWDKDGSFFLEDDDVKDRDSGTFSYKLQNLV